MMKKELRILIQVILLLCFSVIKANEFSDDIRKAFDSIVKENQKNERKGSLKNNEYLLVLSGEYIEDDYEYLRIDSYHSRLQFIKDKRQKQFLDLDSKLKKANEALIADGKTDRVYFIVGENHTIPVRLKEYYGIDEKNAFKHFFTKQEGEKSFFDKEKWDETIQIRNSSDLLKHFAAYRKITYDKLINKISENHENILLASEFNFVLAKKPEYDSNKLNAIAKYGVKNVRKVKGDSKEVRDHVKNFLNATQQKISLFSLADALIEYAQNGLFDGSGPSENYCDDFEFLNELKESDVTASVEALENAISNIESQQATILPKGTFNHFIGNDLTSKLTKDGLQALEDKLQELSKETNKHVIVYFLPLYTNTSYNDGLLTQLAEKSLNEASNAAGKNIVYLIFSHSNYESILWEDKDKTCYNFGYAQTSGIADVQTGLQSGLSERILNIYKNIEKPLNAYGVVRLTDGSVVKLYRNFAKNVKGYSLINGLVLLESPHYEELLLIERRKPTEDDFDLDEYTRYSDEYNEVYKKFQEAYVEWLAKYNKAKKEGIAEDHQMMDSNNKGYGYFEKSKGDIRIRENYITNASYENNLLINYAKYHYDNLNSSWGTGLAYHFGAYESLNDDIHLLDDLDVSKYVYETLDAASLVLAPTGLDVIPDLIGFVYATVVKDDGYQASAYGVSLASVGFAQYFAIGSKYTYKGYKAIGKLDEAGNVVSITPKLDSYVPSSSERELSTILAKDMDEANAILRQDKQYYYLGALDEATDIAKVFGEFSDDIAKKIKELGLPNNGKKFLDDFAGAHKNIIEQIGKNPKLIDSWAVLDDIGVDDAIRKNVSELREVAVHIDAGGGYKAWKASDAGKNNRLWTEITFEDITFQGNKAKNYFVNFFGGDVKGMTRAEFSSGEKMLEFDLKVPNYLQKQGVASAIYKKGLDDFPDTKIIKEEYLQASHYDGGEAINLTVFKQKIANGVDPKDAAFLTPSGKIIERNGFNAVPEIVENTTERVVIKFRPKGSAGGNGAIRTIFDDKSTTFIENVIFDGKITLDTQNKLLKVEIAEIRSLTSESNYANNAIIDKVEALAKENGADNIEVVGNVINNTAAEKAAIPYVERGYTIETKVSGRVVELKRTKVLTSQAQGTNGLKNGFTWSKINNSGSSVPPTEIKLNLGGEGELKGFIDINPLMGNKLSEAQIIDRNSTGGFIKGGAEDLPFDNESISEIKAFALPSPILGRYGDQIASEIKRVLKSGGTASLQSNTGGFAAFEKLGFEISSGGKVATYTKVINNTGDVLPKMERVKLFINNVKNAKPASNVDEAISLINRELDAVEDAFSGVAKNPNAINNPNIDDGRMYGILDNKYIKQLEDGTTRAFTRKNTIIIDQDGAFKLYVRDRSQPNQIGRLILEKPGVTQ